MELINSLVIRVKNKIFSSNSYILKDQKSDSCILIDPGLDINSLEENLNNLYLNPIAILSTHGHFDHISGVSFFKNKYKIPFFIHEGDLKIVQSLNFYLKIKKIDLKYEIPKPDKIFKKNIEIINIDNFELTVNHCPGHSNGSCIIKYHDYLFTGDMIYKKGLGINNFPGEDKIKLKSSIKGVFENFSENCIVYPGHGEPDYLSNIKNKNQELIEFLKF